MNKLSALVILIAIILCIGCQWTNDAQKTIYNEVSPQALLKKYTWFKDTSAELNKKLADIKVYESKFKSLESQYRGEPRNKWLRSDTESWNQWNAEVAGVKASYNSLAAEYNSAMSKINYAFCNVGSLPQGATEPLPREFAQYVEK